MIAKCKGLNIGKFRIPPFELNEGELIGIHLYHGQHFYDLEMELMTLFTGQKTNPELEVYQKLEFVERFKESKFRSTFFPMTVRQYLKSKGKPNSEELNRIYEIDDYIRPNTKVNTLAGNLTKWLSLFATLSKSNKIIFDVAGQDPLGAEKTLDIVNEYVEEGGAAILLDNFDDSKTKCTKFIRVEIKE